MSSKRNDGCCSRQREPRLLQADVIVAVEVVEPDDVITLRQQEPRGMVADESCGTGNKDFYIRHLRDLSQA